MYKNTKIFLVRCLSEDFEQKAHGKIISFQAMGAFKGTAKGALCRIRVAIVLLVWVGSLATGWNREDLAESRAPEN
jgi:hypothetical protein